MIFSGTIFLYSFLPAVLVLYYIIPRRTYRNIILLMASLMFYAWGEPSFVFIMLLEIVVVYGCCIVIEKFKDSDNQRAAKITTILAVCHMLVVLVIYKYLGFIISTINRIPFITVNHISLRLPIGISFFTFQIISYIADVYKGRVKAQKNLCKLALYVSFFPQLIAGPIVRYTDIELAIDKRKESLYGFSAGVERFIIGLGKKVLLADQLAIIADGIFDNTVLAEGMFTELTAAGAWIGAIVYTYQIYFDFSGYSDMAIGLGKMFGFEFPENFNYPYIASSISDFWRRWHISLSSWFRDYLYIPLGGNRKNRATTIRNLSIVWLLTGLWHGANWNFVLWGCIWLALLLTERYVIPIKKITSNIIGGALYRLLIFICICSSWVIFRLTSIRGGLHYLLSMIGLNHSNGFMNGADLFEIRQCAVLLLCSVICSLPWKQKFECIFDWTKTVLLAAVFVFSIASIARGNYSPFIYFNF